VTKYDCVIQLCVVFGEYVIEMDDVALENTERFSARARNSTLSFGSAGWNFWKAGYGLLFFFSAGFKITNGTTLTIPKHTAAALANLNSI
jgi:hypothetical protein